MIRNSRFHSGRDANGARMIRKSCSPRSARRARPVVLRPLAGPLQPTAALFPNLPETLHRRGARDTVLSEAASDAIGLVGPSERRVRHPGELPAEILKLRFIQSIAVDHGHLEIVSDSPFVRPL
jgi:hypothetical protein